MNKYLNSVLELSASRIVDGVECDIVSAVELPEQVKKFRGNEVELTISLIGCWLCIVVPISNTVANSEALEIVNCAISPGSLIVPVVYLPSKERSVDASIRFS